MPPRLALSLTIIFIFILLRLDRKQNPAASPALWIPTFWILLLTSRALGAWTGTGLGLEAGSPLDRNVLSLLSFIGMLILINRNFNWTGFIKNNLWLIILIVFWFTSVLWSDIPFLSLKRLIRFEIVMIIMACLVASEENPRQAVMSVFRRIAYVHIPLSILLIKYYPLLGVQFGRWTGEVMWIGVSSQKNGLASLCLFAIFFLFWMFIRRWRGIDKSATWYHTYIEIFIVMLSFWLFMGPKHTFTYSSTSTIMLLIGITAFLGLLWMKNRDSIFKKYFLTSCILFFIVYGTVTPFLGGLTIIDVSSIFQRESSLTGRNVIWTKLIPIAMEKPFLGHGFAFWTDELSVLLKTINGHNGYLDTILTTGFIGLILSSIFIVNSCLKALREMMNYFDWGIFWFCIILMVTVHNIMESSLDSFTGFFPMIIFLQIVSQYQGSNKWTQS